MLTTSPHFNCRKSSDPVDITPFKLNIASEDDVGRLLDFSFGFWSLLMVELFNFRRI